MHPSESIAQYARGQRVVLCTLPVPAEAASRVSPRRSHIQVVEPFKLKAGSFILPPGDQLWLVSSRVQINKASRTDRMFRIFVMMFICLEPEKVSGKPHLNVRLSKRQ
jgi:hypothetical protein